MVVADLVGDEGAVVVEGEQRVIGALVGAPPVLVVAQARLGPVAGGVEIASDRLELGFLAGPDGDVRRIVAISGN